MKSVEEELDNHMKTWDEDAEEYRIRRGLSEEDLQEMRKRFEKRMKRAIITHRKVEAFWAEERIESAPTTIERSLKPADWLEDGLKKKQLSHSSEPKRTWDQQIALLNLEPMNVQHLRSLNAVSNQPTGSNTG